MCMRHFVNAAQGYQDWNKEEWERARLISFWSSFHQLKNPIKPSDIWVPTDQEQVKETPQIDKEEAYKLLEKWNK